MRTNAEREPVVVVGAGAAGLTAAIFAARAGAAVSVLETRPQPGAKIRVSGGGRCNLLPSRVSVDDFETSGSVAQLRNILLSWPLEAVRSFFETDLGVPLKVEETGKVFPVSDRSKEIVDALLGECARVGVRVHSASKIVQVTHETEGSSPFLLRAHDGRESRCRRLVLATGGLSLPKTGSDGFGLQLAKAWGHEVLPPYPALVPLLTERAAWRELAGVSVRVGLRAEENERTVEKAEGDLLFTHRGFSGPVVLDLSRHLARPDSARRLRVHWGGGTVDWKSELARPVGATTVTSTLRGHLPRRLVAALLTNANVDPGRRLSELPRAERSRLVDVLESTVLPVSGNEGYRTAEVTAGGVALSEVVTATLESRRVPGLYFCGEILDAVGRLGGYNFLWAWVTGQKVGVAVARTTNATKR